MRDREAGSRNGVLAEDERIGGLRLDEDEIARVFWQQGAAVLPQDPCKGSSVVLVHANPDSSGKFGEVDHAAAQAKCILHGRLVIFMDFNAHNNTLRDEFLVFLDLCEKRGPGKGSQGYPAKSQGGTNRCVYFYFGTTVDNYVFQPDVFLI